jgi:hypothetical protein
VSIKHFGLALPVSPFGGVRDSGHGSERGTCSIHPGVRPSRALHRSRTPRWRRARAPVPGLRVSARRVESFQPGRSPGSRSAPRRDRAHANPGAQAGAGSPACAINPITAATWPCGSDGCALRTLHGQPRLRPGSGAAPLGPAKIRPNDPARLFYMATLNVQDCPEAEAQLSAHRGWMAPRREVRGRAQGGMGPHEDSVMCCCKSRAGTVRHRCGGISACRAVRRAPAP